MTQIELENLIERQEIQITSINRLRDLDRQALLRLRDRVVALEEKGLPEGVGVGGEA